MSENEKEEKQEEEETEEESEETEEDSEEESEEESEDTSEDESEEEDWKARALKAEKIIEERKKKAKKQKAEQSKAPSQQNNEGDDALAEVKQKVDSLERIEKKREFGHRNNLAPDVVDKVFDLKEDPKDEDLEDPFIKAGVQALQNQKKNEDNTPESSTRSFGQRLTGKKTKSKAEKQQEFEKYMKAKGVK